MCAPVQLGVSATLNLRDPLPPPGDLLFSLSRGTPAARWGRPRRVGRLGGNPIPSRGFLMAEGHLALSGYATCLQNGGKGSPGQGGAGGGLDQRDWEGLSRPFMAWTPFTS